ncbi:MAG: hypothetical protein V1774_02720 [Candidatus Eisenbacteria bacterium]
MSEQAARENGQPGKFEPLPKDWCARASGLADSFLSPAQLLASERVVLEQFIHLCLRFAYMEKRIQGEILFELSTHPFVIRNEPAPSLLEEAERLAARERKALEIPEGPIEDLAELLDDRGIKTILWPLAPGLRRAGAFLFDERTGPALLSMAPEQSAAGRFILAHEYGHLLVDVDPYANRFCPQAALDESDTHGGGRLFEADALLHAAAGGLTVSEMRADFFARAFLLPPAHFLSSLKLFDISPSRDLNLARLADLAFYYGVETGVALTRIADLGALSAEAVREIGHATNSFPEVVPTEPPPSRAQAPAGSPSHHPTRFVNLGMAMYLKRLVSVDQMATLLGIDRTAAHEFLKFVDPAAIPAEGAEEAGPSGRRAGASEQGASEQRPGPDHETR